MSFKLSNVKRKYADSFRTNFFGLLEYIATIFPNNSDIIDSKRKFELAYEIDNSMIIKAWYSYVYEMYYDIINAGNLRFFLEKDYRKDLADAGVTNVNAFIDIIERVRTPLLSLNDEQLFVATELIKELNHCSYYFKYPELDTT